MGEEKARRRWREVSDAELRDAMQRVIDHAEREGLLDEVEGPGTASAVNERTVPGPDNAMTANLCEDVSGSR